MGNPLDEARADWLLGMGMGPTAKFDWAPLPVLNVLVVFGMGQGALVNLVFNLLVTTAPKELAGNVGSLRGTNLNLAAAVGTAVAGALRAGHFSAGAMRSLVENQSLPIEIQVPLDLDDISFGSSSAAINCSRSWSGSRRRPRRSRKQCA